MSKKVWNVLAVASLVLVMLPAAGFAYRPFTTEDEGDDNIENIYLYGLALDYSLTERLHLVTEISGNRHPDRMDRSEMAAGLLGITYKVSEKGTLDAGFRRGFNDAMPGWNTTIGFSLTF